MKILLIISLP